jgi:hypothetical protein
MSPARHTALIVGSYADPHPARREEFVECLRGLAEKLKKEQATGTPFLLKNLPADHPARVFAREINAGFEATP